MFIDSYRHGTESVTTIFSPAPQKCTQRSHHETCLTHNGVEGSGWKSQFIWLQEIEMSLSGHLGGPCEMDSAPHPHLMKLPRLTRQISSHCSILIATKDQNGALLSSDRFIGDGCKQRTFRHIVLFCIRSEHAIYFIHHAKWRLHHSVIAFSHTWYFNFLPKIHFPLLRWSVSPLLCTKPYSIQRQRHGLKKTSMH